MQLDLSNSHQSILSLCICNINSISITPRGVFNYWKFSTWMLPTYIYKDVWSAGIDSELLCSPESVIMTAIPLLNTLKSSHDTVNFVVGINLRRKAVTRNLFSNRKTSSKYPKIKSLQKSPAIP